MSATIVYLDKGMRKWLLEGQCCVPSHAIIASLSRKTRVQIFLLYGSLDVKLKTTAEEHSTSY